MGFATPTGGRSCEGANFAAKETYPFLKVLSAGFPVDFPISCG